MDRPRQEDLAARLLDAARAAGAEAADVVIASSTYPMDIWVARRIARMAGAVLVHEVHDLTVDGPSVQRELALFKVSGKGEQRIEALRLAEIFRARIVDVAADAVIVEITGTEDKIEGMIELLRPLGIVEMVRTGQVSMTRGVNDGVRRMPGVNGNRFEDLEELAEMAP